MAFWIYINILIFLGYCTYVKCVVSGSQPNVPDDCEDGTYFATWGENAPRCDQCGACRDGAPCNKVTQICPDGCEDWFVPSDQCLSLISANAPYTSLRHITDGPEVKEIEPTNVEICFYQNVNLTTSDLSRYYYYKIQYTKTPIDNYIYDPDIVPTQQELLIHKRVVGLSPNTEYKFRLVLFRYTTQSLVEEISYSAVSYARTACQAPERPDLIEALPSNSLNSITVQWKLLGEHGCNSYTITKIVYVNKNDTYNWMNLEFNPNRDTVKTIYDLIPGSTYTVWINVINDGSMDAESVPIEVRLTQEYLANVMKVMSEVDTDDAEDTDWPAYLGIALGALGVFIGICSIIAIACLCLRKQKSRDPPANIERSSTSYMQPRAASPRLPPSNERNAYEGIPADRTDSHKYNGLKGGEAFQNSSYDTIQ